MTQEEYLSLQSKNINKAISLGEDLLRASATLHRLADDADSSDTAGDPVISYLRDTMQYFSFNDAATELAGMPQTLNDFKKSLIDIKIANDQMLYEGGYRKDIDEAISRVFLSHTLCKIKVIDQKVLSTVHDALETLEALKEALSIEKQDS